jgi:hypothetical protein
MNPFQRLPLSSACFPRPAALGLVAPETAQAGDLNLAGVAKYDSAGSKQQVSSDICVAGYPEGTYRGSAWVGRVGSVNQLDSGIVQV